MKKILGVLITISLILAATVIFAAPLAYDPPAGYTNVLPSRSEAFVYVDFENNSMEPFRATVPDDSSIPPATLTIVNNVAKSGSRSVKVTQRGGGDGTSGGYNTIMLGDIGPMIASNFVIDPDNFKKTETYFISAWVKNVDPNVTQFFWLQLQYGGSGEVWFPGRTYFEVSGSEWTQIGVSVNGYYLPFGEDSTGSGIYRPRGTTTWSGLKFITRNPRVPDEPMVQTNYDFYVDDIIIWKLDANDSRIVTSLPTPTNPPAATATPIPTVTPTVTPAVTSGTTATPVPSESGSETSETQGSPVDSETSTPIETQTESQTVTSDEDSLSGIDETSTIEDSESEDNDVKNKPQVGLIVVIVILVAAVAGGLLFYFLKFKKK